ncbi:hypothetical protein QBC43DRAFT_240602, partial [Cladorrhinum sp. PSN259]
MALYSKLLLLAWSTFAWVTEAQDDAGAASSSCTCSGLDYTNGGSYLIDGTLNSNFTFLSVFSSCSEEEDTCQPILLGPNNRQYPCSPITMDNNSDSPKQSSCGVTYSQMSSGKWTIIIQADNHDFQAVREFELTVTVPERITVTTSLSVLTPQTITALCDDHHIAETRTVTAYPPVSYTTLKTTVQHTRTVGTTTSNYQTTVVATATC